MVSGIFRISLHFYNSRDSLVEVGTLNLKPILE